MLKQDEFLDELKALMHKYEIRELVYTINDDGLHAITRLGEDWELGFISVYSEYR